ncbi:unnamed protein product [Durusdinium trenchii]|uniref:Uncharacterized protein n=1 Tax=Durusdinium trenchii TaxID=1381693 RepID=A0ABP0K2Q3_9DINO
MLHLPRHFPWWPKSDGLIDVAYRVGMTVSNIVSGFFLIDCLRANWAEHKAFAIFFALTGGPILIMRQKEMFTAIQPGPGVKESKHLISCLIGAPIHPRQYHVMGQKARLYCDM